jgi:acyl-CoA synthetase (AMP-forming)/AMP-acid ligase II/uncharacterized membrane protein
MRVERSVVIRASQDRVWEKLADPGKLPTFMASITRFERSGAQRVGVGARYNLRLEVGSAYPGGLIEIVEYEPGWELAWNSVTGLDHRGRWRLRPGRAGTTVVTFRLIYSTPGLPFGPIVDAVSAPLLRDTVRRSLEELKRQLEAISTVPSAPGALELALRGGEDLAVLGRSGLLRLYGPAQLFGLGRALLTWGVTPAAAYASAAALSPDRDAIVDEAGSVTFRDVDRRTNALARGLAELGVSGDSGVGMLARNHRGFIEGSVAAWKLGARTVYLNTSFAGPQLRQVLKREDVDTLIHDSEFAKQVGPAQRRVRKVLSWEEGVVGSARSLEDLIEVEDTGSLSAPDKPGRAVILTSGTTGAPKGAQRSLATSIDPAVALLSRIPLRVEEPTMIAAPLFHAWGFAHLMVGLLLRSTLVLQRRFDPEQVLAGIERNRVTTLVAVPVMLQRILELPARTRRRYDTSSLRVVAVSGSALSNGLAHRFMDEFGDVLYNLYGSTEVAWAAIATPAELRAHAGTAGRPPRGTVVRVYREDGVIAAPGESGQIFVGNDLLFEGYTGGGSKEMRDGLMTTGDLGHFDADGLLFVEGRSDDMIVSGGENVYPGEVEDVIGKLPGVAECAVVGVPDPQFGQALQAFVVRAGRGARVTEDSVRAHVRNKLARYKVPKSVVFVKELPRNATGKVVKKELRSQRPSLSAAR